MQDPTSVVAIAVLIATVAAALWGGVLWGPRRVLPALLLLGPLFLPAFGSVDLPGLPPLDRVSAVTFPALVTMIVVAPRATWADFRWRLPDVALISFISWLALCAAVNQGAWAGLALALKQFVTLFVPYLVGRLYLRDGRDLARLARWAAPVVIVYVLLMVFEARMYPRLQAWVYGSNPIGLARWGLYRPIVFAQNALELGHTMVLLTVVMVAVHRAGGELRREAGRWLEFGMLAGAIAVLLSLSRGPVTGLVLAVTVPMVCKRPAWFACALGGLGIVFFFWMLSPLGSSLLAGVSMIDPSTESQQTLLFRFLQIAEFKPMVDGAMVFGYGESWTRTGIKIIDGILLLTVLGAGYPGVILLAAVWLSLMWLIGRRCFPREDVWTHLGAMLVPVVGWLVFGAWGDAFLRPPHYLVLGGLVTVLMARQRDLAAEQRAAHPVHSVKVRFG